LDWERCAGSLVLRNWRPGDQFHRRGRPAAEKIKTLFQEFRVPLWERRRWPVIARGSSILWTRRFGVARDFAAGPGSGRILVVREVTESNLARATSMQVSMEMKRARDRQFRRSDEPGAEVL